MANFDISCLMPGLLQANPRLFCADCDKEIPITMDLDGRPAYDARIRDGWCRDCGANTTLFEFGPDMPQSQRDKLVKAFNEG